MAARILRFLLGTICGIALFCSLAEVAIADKPKDSHLVAAGLAMALPTYALGVSIHEGSHALAAKWMGAKITDFSLFPGFHPRSGAFYFGYVSVRGLKNNWQRAKFLLAPKLVDTLLLGGFAGLQLSGNVPKNAYGHTALLVLATGFWVDFSKDIFSFSKNNDVVKIYNMIGLDSEWKKLAGRAVHLATSAALGYAVYRGYDELFSDEKNTGSGDSPPAFILPMYSLGF